MPAKKATLKKMLFSGLLRALILILFILSCIEPLVNVRFIHDVWKQEPANSFHLASHSLQPAVVQLDADSKGTPKISYEATIFLASDLDEGENLEDWLVAALVCLGLILIFYLRRWPDIILSHCLQLQSRWFCHYRSPPRLSGLGLHHIPRPIPPPKA